MLTSIRFKIYLSAVGWSTNLLIRLQGNVTQGHLRDIAYALFSNEKVITISSMGHRSLSEFFKYCQNSLLANVCRTGTTPYRKEVPQRHSVISLIQYEGPE